MIHADSRGTTPARLRHRPLLLPQTTAVHPSDNSRAALATTRCRVEDKDRNLRGRARVALDLTAVRVEAQRQVRRPPQIVAHQRWDNSPTTLAPTRCRVEDKDHSLHGRVGVALD